jgi:acylphosphatase
MMKLTAFVSGKVQEVGYRARIVDIANAFGLKGMIENLKDGRVKIIAEGEDEKLKWFECHRHKEYLDLCLVHRKGVLSCKQ